MTFSLQRSLLAVCLSLTFFACSKEEEDSPEASSVSYTPMSVGNYWVYQNYDVDTLGNRTLNSEIDCVYIDRTTIVNGHTYYVFDGTYYPLSSTATPYLWALRDSAGYIVDTTGFIVFSEDDFSDTLEIKYTTNSIDTAIIQKYQMKKVGTPITVPAGSYANALNYHGIITAVKFNLQSGIKNPRDWNVYYARGVGKIKENYFFMNQKGQGERELIRYHVK